MSDDRDKMQQPSRQQSGNQGNQPGQNQPQSGQKHGQPGERLDEKRPTHGQQDEEDEKFNKERRAS